MQHNNIIAVASGKGGVGKTWMSITLAHTIARTGRRVLLVDGDIGLANVDVQLGLTAHKDLGNVISGSASIRDVVIPYAVGGFDIIAGRSGSASLAQISHAALSQFVEQINTIAASYDVVLLDLGAGVEQHVRTLCHAAAQLVVVITDEPTSLTDAYALIKLCLSDKPDTVVSIVVNQAATQKEGDVSYQAISRACANFLSVTPKLLGVVRKDNKVKESIRAQSSIVLRAPHTTAATDVAAIAVKLLKN
jgi:flagellar biosynthesis protein FlhG